MEARRRNVWLPGPPERSTCRRSGSPSRPPIPPALQEAIQKRALRRGKVDFGELAAWKLVYGLVDPSFTIAEARKVLLSWTMGTLGPVLDRIDQLSGTSEHLEADLTGPPKFRQVMRANIMATAWLRRPNSSRSR